MELECRRCGAIEEDARFKTKVRYWGGLCEKCMKEIGEEMDAEGDKPRFEGFRRE